MPLSGEVDEHCREIVGSGLPRPQVNRAQQSFRRRLERLRRRRCEGGFEALEAVEVVCGTASASRAVVARLGL